MPTAPLPSSVADATPAWLTSALAPHFPGVEVAEVVRADVHQVTNTHLRLSLRYTEQAGAPDRLFLKIPPDLSDPRIRASRVSMGKREVLFYAQIAHTLPLRVPAVYFAEHDDDTGAFAMLMEDLVDAGCTVSDGPTSVPLDSAAQALEDLAMLHVRYEDEDVRAGEVPWIPTPAGGNNYGQSMLQYALDNHPDRISEEFASISRLYIDRADDLQQLWRSLGPPTVIHGDPHIGNLFFDGPRVGFLDWGIINVSTPMRDVSYFLNMSLDPADRRKHDKALIKHYLEVREASSSYPIAFNQAWKAHRLHAAYCVPASCQVVMFPPDASPRRQIFAAAFLARAEAAIGDLESRAALREFAGL